MANSEDQTVQTRQPRWFDGVSPGPVLLSLLCCALLLMYGLTLLFDGLSDPIHWILFVAIPLFVRCISVSRSRKEHSSRQLRTQSMTQGFKQIVKTVADTVQKDSKDHPSRNPESGVYSVDFKQTSISDSKTNTLLRGGFSDLSILTIQVTPDVQSAHVGWLVKGTRKTTGKDFYVISEGFVAASGKAYWVETSSYQSLLVTGNFQGNSFTDGEWLSSNGDRGRYTNFHRLKLVEADTAVVLGDNALAQPADSRDGSILETPMLLA